MLATPRPSSLSLHIAGCCRHRAAPGIGMVRTDYTPTAVSMMAVVCCLPIDTVVVDAVDPLPHTSPVPIPSLSPPGVPSTDTHPCHVSRAQHLVANGVAEAACGRMQDAVAVANKANYLLPPRHCMSMHEQRMSSVCRRSTLLLYWRVQVWLWPRALQA